MKFGYFCNTTNWNHKPYNQLLNETQEITTYRKLAENVLLDLEKFLPKTKMGPWTHKKNLF